MRSDPSSFIALLQERLSYYILSGENDGPSGDKMILRLPGKTPIRTNEGAEAVLETIEFLKKQKAV